MYFQAKPQKTIVTYRTVILFLNDSVSKTSSYHSTFNMNEKWLFFSRMAVMCCLVKPRTAALYQALKWMKYCRTNQTLCHWSNTLIPHWALAGCKKIHSLNTFRYYILHIRLIIITLWLKINKYSYGNVNIYIALDATFQRRAS